VQNSDLPTLGLNVLSKKWCVLLYAAGKFVTAGTLYWRVLKNGASQYNSSGSVAANTFYTLNAKLYDIAVDDVLAIKLWSNQSDSEWSYKALAVQVSRIILLLGTKFLKNYSVTIDDLPDLTSGYSPYKVSRGDLNFYVADVRAPWAASSYPATKNIEIYYMDDTYGLFQLGYGDYAVGTGSLRTSTTRLPYYEFNMTPTQILVRGIRL